MPAFISRQRLTSLLIPVLVLSVLIYEVLHTPIYTEGELSAMREKAVALATSGEFDSALEQLRALSEVAPDNRGVWGDYLSVLVRAQREREALVLFAANSQRALPDYTLADLFAAALRQKDFALARQLADREIAQSAEPQKITEARADALAAAGFATAPSTTFATATEFAEPEAALESQPAVESKSAAESAVGVAAPVRAAPRLHRSSAAPSTRPARFSNQSAVIPASAPRAAVTDTAAEFGERAGLAVREAEDAPASERVVRAQMALAALDQYAQALADNYGSAAQIRNEQLDRVRALTLAGRLDEAATVFETLGDTDQLPIYGLLNGADLYVRRQQPARAQALLDIALRREPNNRNALVASFRNQLDGEHYRAAATTLGQLRDTATTSADRRNSRLLTAQLAAYTDHLQAAQTELEALRSEEPDAADVHLRLAQIYRWRGWPRQALDEYRHAENLSADPASTQFGEIAALNDAHEYAAARARLDSAATHSPNHPDLKAALIERRQQQQWQYSAQVQAGKSDASPVTGTGDLAFDQRLTSPVLNDQFRVFAHQHYDWAKFPEGNGSADRFGLGADYRSAQFDTAVELTRRAPGSETGGSLSGEWHANDRLSVFGEAQIDSSAVPLRALNAGIDGDSATVGARYRVDENRQAQIAYSRAEFSDDNNRDAVSASYKQTLLREGRQQIGVIGQLYYGRNSAGDNVPYFNPARETAATANLEYSGPLWQRETTFWSQRVSVGAGVYDQQNYGSHPIWDVEYEQRWRFSPAFEINYGLLHRSRVYDGGREGYSALFGGVNRRF
ncbi:MAG: Tetratricopeptide 2 repeat protein [Verrucomicrobiaceae bacterium]|nr:Tetratricopeptide 2 repeat protein [Verrucomicrobiaceae bacterium]